MSVRVGELWRAAGDEARCARTPRTCWLFSKQYCCCCFRCFASQSQHHRRGRKYLSTLLSYARLLEISLSSPAHHSRTDYFVEARLLRMVIRVLSNLTPDPWWFHWKWLMLLQRVWCSSHAQFHKHNLQCLESIKLFHFFRNLDFDGIRMWNCWRNPIKSPVTEEVPLSFFAHIRLHGSILHNKKQQTLHFRSNKTVCVLTYNIKPKHISFSRKKR